MRYRTIVADPPWPYSGFASSIADNRASGTRDGMATTTLPYSSMSLGSIADLPVADLAERNSFLFLWTTNRYLREAFWIADAWSFTYRQTIVWDKGTSMSPFGGAVTPNRAEYLLVCRRGNAKLNGRWAGGSVVQAMKGSQPGTHSRKPDVFLDMVEQVSPAPRLEMFARRARFGWDYWGDESLSTVEMPA